MKLLLYLALLQNTCIFVRAVNNAGNTTMPSMGNGDLLDISGTGMSTPHISHLASANPFNISPNPQPTSSQSSTMDFNTISGLTNGNIQFPPNVNFDEISSISSVSGRKDNHKGTCEMYVGKTCAQFVGNQSVYIIYPMTQKMLEEKLMKAFQVINFSNELSSNCEGYAKPSLCYSAFPICRDPFNIQKPKNAEASTQLFNLLNSKQDDFLDDGDHDDTDDLSRLHSVPKRSPTLGPVFDFMHNEEGKSSNKKIINQSYGDTRASSRNEINRKLRRICREECEMLENELCRKEYAIAKRHPLIGHQVPLVECSDLPLEGTTEARDCLTLGLSVVNNVQETFDPLCT